MELKLSSLHHLFVPSGNTNSHLLRCFEFYCNLNMNFAFVQLAFLTLSSQIDELLPGYTSKVTENASKLWSITVVATQHYMNNTVSIISNNAPIIANHVTTVVNSTGKWIYELHPSFFDSVAMHAHCSLNCTKRYVNNAWQAIVEYTPIVMEKTVEYMRIITVTLQGYCVAGQIWIQNMLR